MLRVHKTASLERLMLGIKFKVCIFMLMPIQFIISEVTTF